MLPSGAATGETVSRVAVRSWAILVIATVLATVGLRLLHVPAALMLGPMLSAIAVAIYRPGAALPRGATMVAQALLGCLIAHAVPPHLLVGLAPLWPILIGMNLALMLGILGIGILATRIQWLPGTAGIWGMSPGGAAVMVMLADAYGSDKRLVAVMQYLRLLCAALGVIAVGTMLGTPHAGGSGLTLPGAPDTPWLGAVHRDAALATLGLAAAGIAAAAVLKRATLVFFVPVFAGIALQAAGGVAIEVPPLASAAAFTVIGWHIGLSFTRASLMHSARLIPRILAGIAAILALCGLLSLLLAWLARVDLLTAYLALNPGGADAVMIMAASIAVDLPLIMAMQISRTVMVIALAPMLARLAARRHIRKAPPGRDGGEAEELAEDVDSVA